MRKGNGSVDDASKRMEAKVDEVEKKAKVDGIGEKAATEAGGKKRITHADELLMAVAACGELPAQLVPDVVGSTSYAAALITKLKEENRIGCRSGDGLKGYVLHRKGKNYLMTAFSEWMRPFLEGDASLYPVKSEQSKRLRLHRMAYAWVQLYGFGADTFTGKFPISSGGFRQSRPDGSYYSSVLVKQSIAKEAGGSRACGVLDAGEHGFCVYHTMGSLMKWMGRTEWTFRLRAGQALYGAGEERRLQALILAKDMSMMERLLASDGGIKRELFCLDDAYESWFYLPAVSSAKLQYRLLMNPVLERRLERILENVMQLRPGLGSCYRIDAKGCPVYFCWLLELWQIRRIADQTARSGKGKVVCLDYQVEALRSCLGESVSIMGLNTEKVEVQLCQWEESKKHE